MNTYITATAIIDDLSLDSALKDSAQILTNWQPDLSSYQTSNEHHSASIWATTASEKAYF